MTSTTQVGWLYNLGTPTERHKTKFGALRDIKRELKAIATDDPDYIVLDEAIGYRLPKLPGMTQIRDTSTTSRANVAMYVRAGKLNSHRWIDHHQTWSRTQHPGHHEPRSSIVANVDGVKVIGAHNGPRWTDNTTAVQREMVNRLARVMNPRRRHHFSKWSSARKATAVKRPAVVLWDANQPPTADPAKYWGPAKLAELIKGEAFGHGVDNSVGVNVKCRSAKYFRRFKGVRFRSDHRHAVRFEFEIER